MKFAQPCSIFDYISYNLYAQLEILRIAESLQNQQDSHLCIQTLKF